MTAGPSNSYAAGTVFTDFVPPTGKSAVGVAASSGGQSNDGWIISENYPFLRAFGDWLGLCWSGSNLIVCGQVGSGTPTTAGWSATGSSGYYNTEADSSGLYYNPGGTGATLAKPATWPLGYNGVAYQNYLTAQKMASLPATWVQIKHWLYSEDQSRQDAANNTYYSAARTNFDAVLAAMNPNIPAAQNLSFTTFPADQSGVNFTTLDAMIAEDLALRQASPTTVFRAGGNSYDCASRGDGAHMNAGGGQVFCGRSGARVLRKLWELGLTPSGFDGSVLPANGGWISGASLQSYNSILLTVTHDRGDDLIMPTNAGGYGDGGDYGCFTVYDASTSTVYPVSSMTRVSATQFSVGINGTQQINVQFTPYGTSTSVTAATTFTVPYPVPTSGTTQIGPTSVTSPINPSTNLPYFTITPMLINGVVNFSCVKSTGSSTETPSTFLNGNYIGHITDSMADGQRYFIASQTVMPAVPASGTTIHFCDKNGYYLPGGLPTDNFHLKTLPGSTGTIKAKWIAQGLPIQSTDAPIKLGAVGATTTVTATVENTPVGNEWVSKGDGTSVAAGTLAITPATPALTFSTTGILSQATSGATISVPYTLTCATNAQLYFAVLEQDGHTVRTAYAAAPAPTGSGPYTTSITASMALTGDYVQVSTSSTGSPIIGNSQPVTIVVSSSTAASLVSITSPGTLTTSSAGTVVNASITIVTTNTTTPSYQVISNAGAGDRTAVIAYTPNSSGSYTASIPFTASGDYVEVYSDAAGANPIGQSAAATITVASTTTTSGYSFPSGLVYQSAAVPTGKSWPRGKVVIIGQSNAGFALGESHYQTQFANIWSLAWGSKTIDILGALNGSDGSTDWTATGGCALYQETSQNSGLTVDPYGTGATLTDTTTWALGGNGTALLSYNKDNLGTLAAGQGFATWSLWGEYDSDKGAAEVAYYQGAQVRLMQLVRAAQPNLTALDMPFFWDMSAFGENIQAAGIAGVRAATENLSAVAANATHRAARSVYDCADRGDGAHMSSAGDDLACARAAMSILVTLGEQGRLPSTFNDWRYMAKGGPWVDSWSISGNVATVHVTHLRGTDLIVPTATMLSNTPNTTTGGNRAFVITDPDTGIVHPITSMDRVDANHLALGINGAQFILVGTSDNNVTATASVSFQLPSPIPTTGTVSCGAKSTNGTVINGVVGLTVWVTVVSGVVTVNVLKQTGVQQSITQTLNGDYSGYVHEGCVDSTTPYTTTLGAVLPTTPGPNSTLDFCQRTDNNFYGPSSLPTDNWHLMPFPTTTAAVLQAAFPVGLPVQKFSAPIKVGTTQAATLDNTEIGTLMTGTGSSGTATVATLDSISSPGTQTVSASGTVVTLPITMVTELAPTASWGIYANGTTRRGSLTSFTTPGTQGVATSTVAQMPFSATGDVVKVYSDTTGTNLLGTSSAITINVVTPTLTLSTIPALTHTAAGVAVTASVTVSEYDEQNFYYWVKPASGTPASPYATAWTEVNFSGTSNTATYTFYNNGDILYVTDNPTSPVASAQQSVTISVSASSTPTLVSVTAPGSLTQSAAGVAVNVPTTFVTTGVTQFYWSVFGQVTSGSSTSYPLRAGPTLLATTGTATASVPYSYTGDFLKVTTDSSASNAIGYGAAATLTVAASTTTTNTVASLPTTLSLALFSNQTGQDFTSTTAFNSAVWTNVYGTGFTWTSSSDGLRLTSSASTSPAWQQSGFMQLFAGTSAGFGYGLFTFRARTGQSIQGPGVNLVLWNADGSWLSSGNVGVTGKGTYSEVDLLESINGTATVQGTGFSTLHYYDSTQTNDNGQDSVVLVDSSAAAINLNTMHDYALYWADGIMALYVDETLLWQRTGERVPKDYAHGGCNKTLGAQVVVPSGTTEVATSVVLNIASMYHYTGSLTTGTTATAGLPAIPLPTYAFRPNFDGIGQNPQFEYYYKGENDIANQVALTAPNGGGSDNYRNQSAWLRTTGNYAGPSTGFQYWSIAFRNFVRVTANPANTSTVIVYADNTSYLTAAGEPLMFWAPTPTISSTTASGVTTYSVSDDNPAQALTAFPFTSTSVKTAATGTTAEVLTVAPVSVPWTTFPTKTALIIASSSTVNLDANMNEIASGASTTIVKANAERYVVTLPAGVTCPAGFNWTYLTAAQYPSLTNPALYGRHNSFYANSQTKTMRWQVQAMLTAALTWYLPRGASFTYGGLQGEPTYRDWGSEFADFGDLGRTLWTQEMQGIGAQLQTWHDPNKICVELENEPTSATWAIYNTNLAFMLPVARAAVGPNISLGIKGIGYGSLNQALTGFTIDLRPYNPCVFMAHAYVYQNTYSSYYPNLTNNAASYYDSNGRNSTNGQLISWADDIDGQYCADVFTVLRARTGAVGAGFSELGISNYYYPTDTIRDRMLGRLVASMSAANHFVMNWNGNSDTDITNGYADDGATGYGSYVAGTQLVLSRPVFRATGSYATLVPTLEAAYATFTAPTLAVVPSFGLTGTTVPTTIAAGATGTSTIAIGATATYATTVSLSVLAPTGITVSLSSTSAATGGVNLAKIVTATHTVASTVAAGTYAVIVSGTDGTTTRTTSLPVVVTASGSVVVTPTPVTGLPITTLPTDLPTALTSISTLNTAVGSVETSVAALQTSVTSLQASAVTLQAALTALQAQATAINAELSAIANLIRGPHA